MGKRNEVRGQKWVITNSQQSTDKDGNLATQQFGNFAHRKKQRRHKSQVTGRKEQSTDHGPQTKNTGARIEEQRPKGKK
jgi:hypothetical protein